jgi:hypothetical protein
VGLGHVRASCFAKYHKHAGAQEKIAAAADFFREAPAVLRARIAF